MTAIARQRGPRRYELDDAPAATDECRSCGREIVALDGRWHALAGLWPNLAHCYYEYPSGESVGHVPAPRA